MDVAEQALTALAMLSRRHGKAILQAVRHVINTVVISGFYKKKKQTNNWLNILLSLCFTVNYEYHHTV